jgi:hypothetical protein
MTFLPSVTTRTNDRIIASTARNSTYVKMRRKLKKVASRPPSILSSMRWMMR